MDTVRAIPAIDTSIKQLFEFEARRYIKTSYMPSQDTGVITVTNDQVEGVIATDVGKMILFGTNGQKAGVITSFTALGKGADIFNVRLIPNS